MTENVADLGIGVNSTGVVQGVKSLNDLYAAATKAEGAASSITNSYNVASAAAGSMANATRATSAALDEEARASANAARSAQAHANAIARTTRSSRGFSSSVANLTAQFQDIAVTTAAGTSPLTIALQQGTQIAGVFQTAGLSLRSIGSAFAALVSPTALITIGLIAAGSALIQYVLGLDNSKKVAEDTLKKQADLVKNLAKEWGALIPSFQQYADLMEKTRKESDLITGKKIIEDSLWVDATEAVNGVFDGLLQVKAQLEATGKNKDMAEVTRLFNELEEGVKSHNVNIEQAKKLEEELSKSYDDSGVELFKDMADAIHKVVIELENAKNKTTAFNDEITAAEEKRRNLYPSPDDEFTPRLGTQIPIPTKRANVELEGLPQTDAQKKAEADLKKTQEAYKGLIESQNSEIEKLNLEASMIGATAQAKALAIAKMEAEQALRAANIPLLSKEAEAYKANAAAMAMLKLKTDQMAAGYQTVQNAGMSAIDQLTASIGDMDASLEDFVKNLANTLLAPLKELAIANPLKNAIYGTNLPTLQSIGGFEGFAGALSGKQAPTVGQLTPTTTTTMSVTAAVVNIAGAGLPALPNVAGAANPITTPEKIAQTNLPNVSAVNGTIPNGVRPTLTSSGIQNTPGVVPVSVANAGKGFTEFNMSDGTLQRRDGSFAWRNNNPGNIESGAYAASQPGYMENGGRFAAFKTFDQGQAARENLMFNSPSYRDKTLEQAINRYAPPSENNTESYIQQLSSASGVDRNTLMKDIPADQRQLLLQKQMEIEGFAPGKTTTTIPNADKAAANIQKLSTSSSAASQDLSGLGNTTNELSSNLSDSLGKIATPAVTPTVAATPAASPTGGFNIFSLLGSLFGFSEGGYTGHGGKNDPAGIVHRGEYVINKNATGKFMPLLAAINNGDLPGYSSGGYVGSNRGSSKTNMSNYSGSNKPNNTRVNLKRKVELNVSGSGDKELLENMRKGLREAVKTEFDHYDREILPTSISRVNADRYARG